MNSIHTPNNSFSFSKIRLSKPILRAGGNHVISCSINEEPFYIQPPKCNTKQGIVEAGKKKYTDLMFTQENDEFISWMENLETYFQEHLFQNKDEWFDGSMELHDIENFFTSPLKSYKSGKFYLCRVNIKSHLGSNSIKVFDEDENEHSLDSIKEETKIHTILEIKGIKCTSSSFNIDFELKQILIIKSANLFDKCLFPVVKKEITQTESFTNEDSGQPENDVDNVMDEPVTTNDESKETEVEIKEDLPFVIEENTEETKNLEEMKDLEKSELQEPEDVYQPELENDVLTENQTKDENVNEVDEVEELEEMSNNPNSLEEIDLQVDAIKDEDTIQIRKRNDVYYEMYKEARKKAKVARDLALSSYLEAKRIKNTYMLDDIEDSDSSDLELEEKGEEEKTTTE